jgi:hypothetical protein
LKEKYQKTFFKKKTLTKKKVQKKRKIQQTIKITIQKSLKKHTKNVQKSKINK